MISLKTSLKIRSKSAIEMKLDIVEMLLCNIRETEKNSRDAYKNDDILQVYLFDAQVKTMNILKDQIIDMPTIKGGD